VLDRTADDAGSRGERFDGPAEEVGRREAVRVEEEEALGARGGGAAIPRRSREGALRERDPREVERSAGAAAARRYGRARRVVRRAVDDDDLEARRVALRRERVEAGADRPLGAVGGDDDRELRRGRRPVRRDRRDRAQ
jgi:hypothetical protein